MKSKLNEPLLILLFTVLALSGISFIPVNFFNLKLPDYLADLKVKAKEVTKTEEQIKYAGKMDSSFVAPQQMLSDTTLASFGDLTKFFEALYLLQQKPEAIHISYFGDSMIEGDLITMDLRKMFQNKFGGRGIGYMPVTSATANFRSTIQHSFNEQWETVHFNQKAQTGKELGWSGFNFIGNQGANVKFKKSRGQSSFNHVELFYRNKSTCRLSMTKGSNSQIQELVISDSIQALEIQDSIDYDQLEIEISEGNPEIMGLNFENGPGIYVDNYAFRGNSGIPLGTIKDEMFSYSAQQFNCRLVVLHYGLNVVGHETGDYSWYLNPFRKVIRKIKKAYPNATIVLASVGDKSYNYGQQYHTEPDIPLFVGMQVKLAKEENIVFWNMYKAMGGYDSMKRWVEEKPKKAAKDYTHLNSEGAKEIARLFYEWLMNEYNIYLEKKLDEVSKQQFQTKNESKQ
jgi:hypothetical protein